VVGCMSGLILATSWRYAYLASHARIDMLFVFFITLAFVGFWKMIKAEDGDTKKRAGICVAVALGLAILTKGPLGIIFPLLAWFVFTWWVGQKAIPWLRLIVIPRRYCTQ